MDLNDYFSGRLPKLIVVSGPTCSGKTTIVEHICLLITVVIKIITATTRPKRKGELEGVDYFFKKMREFRRMISFKQFYEYTRRGKHFYGVLKSQLANLDDGQCRIFVVDFMGVEKIARDYPDAPIFWIDVDRQELRERLIARDRDSDDRKRRLEQIDVEINWHRENAKRLNIITLRNPNGRDIEEVGIELLEKAA